MIYTYSNNSFIMMLNIGDKVKFLDEEGGGTIVELIDELMLMVETEDGFNVPYMLSQLIPAGSLKKELEEGTLKENKTSENEVPASEQEAGKPVFEKEEAKVRVQKAAKARKEKMKYIEEVDLHIQNIVDDYSLLTPGEILDLQMSRFELSLEGAIRHEQKEIIFIHGKGAGKLKSEIQKKLINDYPRLKYQDASFKEYGYGATLIFIT